MVKKNTIMENMNLVMQQDVSPLIIGTSLAYEIFLNRVRQTKTYDHGMIKRFQNFEKNALERSLENLVANQNTRFEWTKEMKDLLYKKHSLNKLNFVYDGIMFLNEKRRSSEEICEYLGEKAVNTLTKTPPPGKTIYFAFLNNIKSDIANNYNIIFD